MAIWPSTRVRTVIEAMDSALPTASAVIGAGRFSLTLVSTGTASAGAAAEGGWLLAAGSVLAICTGAVADRFAWS